MSASIIPLKISQLALLVSQRKHILVANDNLYATINLYENRELCAEAAVIQLKTHVLFNQVSFHTKKLLTQLHFVESIMV